MSDLVADAEALSDVYWIGGSPCAGKSSIADLLGRRFDLTVYHADERMDALWGRVTPARQPVVSRLADMGCDELWMRPVAEQVATAAAAYDESFDLILDELLPLAQAGPLLVEDAALLPARVIPLLTDPRRAVWVVPTPAFQREHYSRRPWVTDVLRDCADPDAAFERWMRRDERLADWVVESVRRWGGVAYQVDGTRTVAELATLIAARFGLDR